MFKKQFKIASQHLISAKDRKKMKLDMIAQHFDKESVEKLFVYADSLTAQKLEKSKITIYRDEADPLIVDSTSGKDYFPSVYCLMMFPDLVKIVFELKHEVEHFLYNGAQLMWPGIANFGSLPDFQGDEVVAIKTSEGKIIAVGAIACPKRALEAIGKIEGVAAYILHICDDQLFETGSKVEKKPLFKKKTAGELQKQAEDQAINNSEPQNEDEEEADDDVLAFYKQINKSKNTNGTKSTNLKKSGKTMGKSRGLNKDDSDEEHTKQKRAKKRTEEKEKPIGKVLTDDEKCEQKDKAEGNQSTKDMDNKLLEAVLNCMILSLKDDDLPMENANLWNNHILLCRHPDSILDIKASSYKKLGKFFAHLDKLGMITYKEATKKSATPSITQINRKHGLVSGWEPTVSCPMAKEVEERPAKENVQIISYEITNMCKPSNVLRKYLSLTLEAEFISNDEMEKRVREFLKKGNLLQKDQVVVNEALRKDFGIPNEESDDEAGDIDDDEITESKAKPDPKEKKIPNGQLQTIKMTKFMQLLSKHQTFIYKILDLKSKKETTKQGRFEGVSIFAEKAHNKFVTRVTSLSMFGLNVDQLVSEWQVKFATNGSIHEVTFNKQHVKEIHLQGIFIDEIKEYLTLQLKIPESLINTINKVDKKKKKNTKQM
jgi:translation initiation factor 2D